MKRNHVTALTLLVILILAISACVPQTSTPMPQPPQLTAAMQTATPFQPETPTPAPTATSLPELSLYVEPSVSALLGEQIPDYSQVPGISSVRSVDRPQDASLALAQVSGQPQEGAALIRWVYALVAPFPTVADGVTFDQLRAAWQGQPIGEIAPNPLLMTASTLTFFNTLWGAPADGAARVLEPPDLLAEAWAQPALAIVPFEALEPRWKVLSVDGMNPIHRSFDLAAYPLTVTFALTAAPDVAARLKQAGVGLESLVPAGNRDPSKMTTLLMTGVTALVRATAARMEAMGVLYPGQDIAATLRDNDLTHISNEIAFKEGCPPPNPWTTSLFFCSDPKYIGLLDDVGTDIIELTGNHMMDYGTEALPLTIKMYDERGWKYYGGGIDLANSMTPALVEHNGNKLAFIGCNPSGPDFAWATDEHSGAAPCGDYQWLIDEVTRLKSEGYLVIVTFQYFENYSLDTSVTMREDFARVAEAGPVIINGSQAHVPKGFRFHNGAFIHYGLGNLFFDQMQVQINGQDVPETRWEFMDRHVFYNGRHISVELLTNMLEDYAKPRPMTERERAAFLETMSGYSYFR